MLCVLWEATRLILTQPAHVGYGGLVKCVYILFPEFLHSLSNISCNLHAACMAVSIPPHT